MIEAAGLAPIECQDSNTTGTQLASDEAQLQITFTSCSSEGTKCTSYSQAEGTIVTEPLESYTYEEGSEYRIVLGGSPIMSFNCTHGTLTLSGTAGGQLGVPIDTPDNSSKSAFGTGLGEQNLQLDDEHANTYVATLTTAIQITDTQTIELRAKPY